MNEGNTCPECGNSLPSDAPGGLCPGCLLQQGVGAAGDNGLDPTTPSSGAFVPPTPRELAPSFPQLEVIRLLGQGGMGAVYLARQIKLDRLVALKIIHPESASDPAFAERFMREARTLARLNHSGVVGVHDFGELPDGSAYFFLMEYVDGVNLRELIHQKSLSPPQTLAIIQQICEALQYAHDCGVVHRDIKPENILVNRHGSVKIADFGLARLVESSPSDYTLTKSHQVMGTPRYMSPEQMSGSHEVDHRADIYSLGVVFYELLTGEVPMGQFEPPSRRGSSDVRLDEIVMRALAREPERRYQSASELKLSVDAITSGAHPAHDLVAGAPEPPQGVSSIVEREAAAAWRWVAGQPDPWTRKPESPALLMFALAVAGCLMVLLPWMDYQIDEPESSQQARAAVVSAKDTIDAQAETYFPIVQSVRGTEYSGATIASVAFTAIALLILATPRDTRRSVWWSMLVTLLAGIALVSVLAFRVEADQQWFTVPHFKDGQWVQERYIPRIADYSYRIGYFVALALSIAQLVFGATGIRHAIATRSSQLAATSPSGGPANPFAAASEQPTLPEFADSRVEFEPRFSRKAILGAVWALIFVVGLPIVVAPAFVVHRVDSNDAAAGAVAPTAWFAIVGIVLSLPIITAPIGTTVLGLVAISQIRYSRGRLIGLGLAFFDAIFFPAMIIIALSAAGAIYTSSPNEQPVAITAAVIVASVFVMVMAWLLWRTVSRLPSHEQPT